MHKAVRCFISKVYHVYKEQVHLTGYLGLLAVLWAIYTHVSTFIDAADANTASSAQHETRLDNLETWKSQVNVDLAVIAQQVKDIHEVVVGK